MATRSTASEFQDNVVVVVKLRFGVRFITMITVVLLQHLVGAVFVSAAEGTNMGFGLRRQHNNTEVRSRLEPHPSPKSPHHSTVVNVSCTPLKAL